MAADGWFPSWFEAAYFPPVWFAPGDESQVPAEELREEYHGGGKRRQSRRIEAARQESESEILRLVEAKWEAIESGRAQETPVPSTRPEPPVEKTQEIEREVVLAMPAGKTTDFQEVPKLTSAVDPEANEARKLRQRMNNDHALILMLAELL